MTLSRAMHSQVPVLVIVVIIVFGVLIVVVVVSARRKRQRNAMAKRDAAIRYGCVTVAIVAFWFPLHLYFDKSRA